MDLWYILMLGEWTSDDGEDFVVDAWRNFLIFLYFLVLDILGLIASICWVYGWYRYFIEF